MALFDSQLLFTGTAGSPYQSLVVTAATSGTVASTNVIDLVNARDLGQSNDGMGSVPKVFVFTSSSGITSACGSATLNIKFQGSTDSTNWTTYMETGPMTTASLGANTQIAVMDWPQRAVGAALPRYIRLGWDFAGSTTAVISTGAVFAGIALEGFQNSVGNYPSGFTVS